MNKSFFMIIVLFFVIPACYSTDYTNNARPYINVTFEDTVKSIINVSIDGDKDIAILIDVKEDKFFSYRPKTDLDEGQHTFSITAENEMENQATITKKFIVDTIPPEISLNIKEGDLILDSKKRLDIELSERVETVYVEINGRARSEISVSAAPL